MRNIPLSLAVSAAAGAFTLLRPADWSPRARRAYVVLPGVLAGAGSALLFFGQPRSRPPEAPGAGSDGAEDPVRALRRLPPSMRLALPLGIGAAVSGSQALSLRIDSSVERWLLRRGLRHPRRWMAVFAVLACLATDLAGNSDDSGDPPGAARRRSQD